MKTKKKLLLISDSMVSKKGGIYFAMNDTFLQFIRHLKDHFEHVTLCCPVSKIHTEQSSTSMFPIDIAENLEIRETFPYKSVADYYKKLPLIFFNNIPVFINSVKNADMILLRAMGMNTFLVALIAFLYRKSVFSYIVGDQKLIVEMGSKYKGVKLTAALFVSNFHSFLYKKIIRLSNATFFLSTELKNKLGKFNSNSYFMFTSLIEENIISNINNSLDYPHDLANTLNLLYVGRLSHEKGLEYLIQSVGLLIEEGYNIK